MGEFNLPRARGNLLEWIEKARSHSLKRILCDITLLTGFGAQQMLSMIRFNTGQLVAQSIPRDFRVVVLETPQQLIESQSKFGENVMVNRGVAVKVTTHLNEALSWLGVVSADPEQIVHQQQR
jgi:hypothetical protein